MNIDPARIVQQVNAFWADHGYTVILATGLVALALVVIGLVKVARSRQRDRWVSGLTAVVVLAWTSEGLWEVARHTLALPVAFAVMTFFVFESMMLSSAMQAEQHRRRHGTPGPAGRYVWVLASLSATVVALNAATLVEAVLRFTLPLAAAGLWWVGITAERDSDDQPCEDGRTVREKRQQAAQQRAATWAVTPRTLLVRLGVMRPGAQTVTDAEREYRVRRMVVYADRAHSARSGGRAARYAAYRLRRLARLATAEDVATVRDRVTRTTGILALVTPAGHARLEPGITPDRAVVTPDAMPEPPDRASGGVPARASGMPDPTPVVSGRASGMAPGHGSGTTAGQSSGTPEVTPAVAGRAVATGDQPERPVGPGGQSGGRGPRPVGHREPGSVMAARSSGTPDRESGIVPWPRDRAWQEYRAAAESGEPLSPAELARRAGRDPKTAWRWIKDWQTGGLLATPQERPVSNGHQRPDPAGDEPR